MLKQSRPCNKMSLTELFQHLYRCFGRWNASVVTFCFWRKKTDLFDWNVKSKKHSFYILIKLQTCQRNVTFLRMNKNDWANTCCVKSGSGRILPIEEWWKEFCFRPQCAEGLCLCFFPSFFSLFPIALASVSLIGHLCYQFERLSNVMY